VYALSISLALICDDERLLSSCEWLEDTDDEEAAAVVLDEGALGAGCGSSMMVELPRCNRWMAVFHYSAPNHIGERVSSAYKLIRDAVHRSSWPISYSLQILHSVGTQHKHLGWRYEAEFVRVAGGIFAFGTERTFRHGK
jgi:hypothetical protein